MRRRVVITGTGCITPLGADVVQFWDHLASGSSGVGRIGRFDASRFPVRIAAEVRGWDDSASRATIPLWDKLPRQTQFAIASALDAVENSGVATQDLDPLRMGVSLGCGEIFPDFHTISASLSNACADNRFDAGDFLQSYLAQSSPLEEIVCDPAAAVEWIAAYFQTRGPVTNYTTACASSTVAIGNATEWIRRNDADLVLAGGSHSMVNPFGLTGLCRMSVLSQRNAEPERASRPFDANRDGFVIGEGGAVLVLEELEHARRRDAEILGEVTGFASTHDAFRVTDPQPDGRDAARCIRLALQDARLNPEDIGYVNAHGSGTPLNDHVETVALKAAFGNAAYRIPTSSTKSMTGHLTTACGAIEVLACLMVIRNGIVPPTINCETPDPRCDLDYVPNMAREVTCRHALNNNSGFGGQNASLIISRYEKSS